MLTEYLSSAECFRKVSVDKCGTYYSQLIDHVSNPKSHDDHICWWVFSLFSLFSFTRFMKKNDSPFIFTPWSYLITHLSSSRPSDRLGMRLATTRTSSYGQFRTCVHDPLLRECGHRARNLMDHSLGFLVSKCADKSYFRCGMRALCGSSSERMSERGTHELCMSGSRTIHWRLSPFPSFSLSFSLPTIGV